MYFCVSFYLQISIKFNFLIENICRYSTEARIYYSFPEVLWRINHNLNETKLKTAIFKTKKSIVAEFKQYHERLVDNYNCSICNSVYPGKAIIKKLINMCILRAKHLGFIYSGALYFQILLKRLKNFLKFLSWFFFQLSIILSILCLILNSRFIKIFLITLASFSCRNF